MHKDVLFPYPKELLYYYSNSQGMALMNRKNKLVTIDNMYNSNIKNSEIRKDCRNIL